MGASPRLRWEAFATNAATFLDFGFLNISIGYCPQVDDDPGAFGRLDVTGAPLLVTLSRLPERCSQSTTLSLKP